MSTTHTIHISTNQSGLYEIHKPNCKSLSDRRHNADGYIEEYQATTHKALIDYLYGDDAGSYYEDNGLTMDDGWTHFRSEVHICNCARTLIKVNSQ